MIKVALSHDVDRTKKTYQYLTRPLKNLIKLDLKGSIRNIGSFTLPSCYWGFDDVIDIETKHGVKSTFYFLNETVPFNLIKPGNWKLSLGRYKIKDPDIIEIIKFLDNNGWEIGLHGSFLSYKNKELLTWEKYVLESIVGHKIFGIRQHYLNLSENTWNFQYEVGFKYDSSWGFTREIGFKENKLKPFRPLNNEFLVIPMVIMDNAFVNSNNKWDKLKRIFEIAEENDSLLVINWHTNNYDENDYPNFKKDYIRIIEECTNIGAKFYTIKDYYLENQQDYFI